MKHGFTLLEMMVAVTILGMVTAGVFVMTTEGQKNVARTMQSHIANDEVQMAANQISDDCKEANLVLDPDSGERQPPFLTLGSTPLEEAFDSAIQNQTLKTVDPNNRLTVIQFRPQTVSEAGGQAKSFFAQKKLEYFMKQDPSAPKIYGLFRKSVDIDSSGGEVTTSARIRQVIPEIDTDREYFVFFRVENSGAISARNIYFAASLTRRDPKAEASTPLFTSAFLNSAHIRGTVPDVY
jgi:prepilin-type N-terminal cleavage/methylation domain-containing protein